MRLGALGGCQHHRKQNHKRSHRKEQPTTDMPWSQKQKTQELPQHPNQGNLKGKPQKLQKPKFAPHQNNGHKKTLLQTANTTNEATTKTNDDPSF